MNDFFNNIKAIDHIVAKIMPYAVLLTAGLAPTVFIMSAHTSAAALSSVALAPCLAAAIGLNITYVIFVRRWYKIKGIVKHYFHYFHGTEVKYKGEMAYAAYDDVIIIIIDVVGVVLYGIAYYVL